MMKTARILLFFCCLISSILNIIAGDSPQNNGVTIDDSKTCGPDQVCNAAAADSEEEYLEPYVEVIRSVFTPEDCRKIIDATERIGFQTVMDTIDDDVEGEEPPPSWALDVAEEGTGRVVQPEIAALYEPYLSKINEIVASRKRDIANSTEPPSLDWVFVRKYQANQHRNQLKLHHDLNLFTLNLQLNSPCSTDDDCSDDDYTGGGLFFHKAKPSDYDEGEVIPDFSLEVRSYMFVRSKGFRTNIFAITTRWRSTLTDNIFFVQILNVWRRALWSLKTRLI